VSITELAWFELPEGYCEVMFCVVLPVGYCEVMFHACTDFELCTVQYLTF